MKILILGGDGYCGWATALHLSKRGHAVLIVENFARRQWDHELGAQTLTPVRSVLIERLPDLRVEAEQHHYNARHSSLLDLGLAPHYLSKSLLDSLMNIAIRYRDRIDSALFLPRVDWRRPSNQFLSANVAGRFAATGN